MAIFTVNVIYIFPFYLWDQIKIILQTSFVKVVMFPDERFVTFENTFVANNMWTFCAWFLFPFLRKEQHVAFLRQVFLRFFTFFTLGFLTFRRSKMNIEKQEILSSSSLGKPFSKELTVTRCMKSRPFWLNGKLFYNGCLWEHFF